MWRSKYKKNNTPQPVKPPVDPQRQLVRRQIIIGVIITVTITLLLTSIWYITRLPSLQVQSVVVTGGETIPHETIKKVVEVELNGAYIRLIPKRFTFMYPEERIKRQILDISRVKNADLQLDDDNNVAVVFEEYIPYGLWCPSIESSECLFIDSVGFAFAPAPDLTGAAFVRYVTDNEPAVKTTMTETAYLDEVGLFVERMEAELGLFVTHVVKAGDYDTEYYVSGGGQVKVSQSIGVNESFSNLKSILTSEDFVHIEPGNFNYIDLRFGDKVFVNEVKEVVATTTPEVATSTADASSVE